MTYWRTFYHIVWATKDREPVVLPEFESIIETSVRTYCAQSGSIFHAIGIMPDHVHVVTSIPPSVAVSDLVKNWKGGSSHLINERSGTRLFRWQPQFSVFSFDEGRLPRVIEYVQNQREHHARNTLRPKLEITELPR